MDMQEEDMQGYLEGLNIAVMFSLLWFAFQIENVSTSVDKKMKP